MTNFLARSMCNPINEKKRMSLLMSVRVLSALYNKMKENVAVCVTVVFSENRSIISLPTHIRNIHHHMYVHTYRKLNTRAQNTLRKARANTALSAGAENNKLLHVYVHSHTFTRFGVFTHRQMLWTDQDPP